MSWKVDKPLYNDEDRKMRQEIRETIKSWGARRTKRTVSELEWMERVRLGLPTDELQTMAEFLQKATAIQKQSLHNTLIAIDAQIASKRQPNEK